MGTTDAASASTPDKAADDTAKPAAADTKPAADTTTKDDTTPADKGKEPGSKDGAPASKAPEKYALTLPAGGYVDAGDLVLVEGLARKHDWTNEDAQGYVNQRAAELKATNDRFVDETKADSTYGGAHFDETQQHVTRALDHFRPAGTPRGDALRGLLNKSGYGNHIEVVSLLADLGKAMAEDGTVGATVAGGGAAATKSHAELIYGDSKAT